MKLKVVILACLLPVAGWGQATEHLIAAKNYCNLGNCYNPGTSDFSALVFFKTAIASGTFVTMLSKNNEGNGDGRWAIYISSTSSGKARIIVGNTGSGFQVSATTTNAVNDGVWHCVAATADRDGLLSIYMDGRPHESISMAAGSGLNFSNSFPICAGASAEPNPNQHFFTGQIAESRVYNRVLTETDLKTIWNAFPNGSDNITSGLIAKWRGDATAQTGATLANGAIVPDISGNNNHGYATNGVISAPSIIGNRRLK